MEITLTRYLYVYDEVILSLLTELLSQKNIETCYYLTSEIYHTNCENIFDLLWKIYFDFYAEYNGSFETCIANKQNVWLKHKTIKPVLFIVKNMFYLHGSSNVFHLRQFVENGGKCLTLYRLHRPLLLRRNWDHHDKLLCRLFLAVEKRHFKNAAVYLMKLQKKFSSDSIYFSLIDYFASSVDLKKYTIIQKRWSSRLWKNDYHMLLAFILYMTAPLEKIKKRFVYKPLDKEEIKFVEDISNIENIPPYKQLLHKRRSVISPEISSFHSSCDSDVNYKNNILNNWEYYANRSNIWKKRIAAFGGYVKNERIVFHCEDEMERFYNLYGLELDEQPLYIQNMGFLDTVSNLVIGSFKQP